MIFKMLKDACIMNKTCIRQIVVKEDNAPVCVE